MASRQWEVLEQISSGKMTWAPKDTSEAARESFDKIEGPELIDILNRLKAHDFIGDYITHRESTSGKRRMDRVLITKGLTLKGQDKSQWPD